MSCLCRFLSTVPAPGDGEVVILSKILQVLNDGGGSGLGGVSSISVNGGPAQTGAVSITTGGSSLLNFTDENSDADGVMWGNAGTTEILRSVGSTGFLQTTAGRIHRDVDNSVLAFLGGTAKSTSSFFEMAGQSAASPGFAVVTTKGQTLGAGTFRIINAPNSSTVGTVRAEMVWEGNWALTPIWNDVANAFVAFDVNPTNTLSAAGALLGRFRASSVSQWEVSKAGATTQLGSGTMTQLRLPNTSSATVGGIYFSAILSIHNFGTNNFFAGVGAGNLTMTGTSNTGIGFHALDSNTTGVSNMAVGRSALDSNTTGSDNAAIGVNALVSNDSGANNTAIGSSTMLANVTGTGNTAVGYISLFSNTGSSNNTGVGGSALFLTTGANNIALGFQAGDNLTTGSNNIIIGYNINSPTATNSNTLTIGNLIFGTGIDGVNSAVSSGNIAVGIITPFQKFSVLGAIGAYELATDSSNYSRTSITPQAGNHLIRTEAIGTGTLRILQVGTGPRVGTDIAGVNAIFHGGQSTGAGAGGSALIQVSPAGGAGSGVNALVTRIEASNTGLGFFATAPAAKQVSGENLTNNVASGGTDGTIANYTDLTIYANDSAAIRNDIYQLARKLKQVNDALRLYGLLT